ncbi:MAG: FAD-dependent oxidoreductase [Rhodospirillales bacterium]|nr:FAD-dependent oxidoreductase [Rhodospirillales bacterium]
MTSSARCKTDRIYAEQAEKLPPCRTGCPGGADVRGWIGVIAQREKSGLPADEAYRRAWEIIVDRNPFPSVMGRICPHPCEDGCNRVDKDGAVSINAMERFIGDWAIERAWALPVMDEGPQAESIGVIGAGPAGLSFAYQMARRGYSVHVYEASDTPGGMLRHGIPAYRLPEDILAAEIARIVAVGVELHLASRIGGDLSLAKLRERHDALFLGIGAQRARRLGIPGEDGPGVWTGTEYLGRKKNGQPIDLGRKVAVIGGGNTAIDAARSARRDGAEVVLVYRRSRDEMPAADHEIEDALVEKVGIECLAAPVEIRRNDGHVRTLIVQKMELGELDASGRRRPVPIGGKQTEMEVDSVITAVSQEPEWDRLDQEAPDGARMESRLWAGGDALGLGTASIAIAQGRLAAETMQAELRGLPAPQPLSDHTVQTGQVKLDYYDGQERVQRAHIPTAQWLSQPDMEVDRTITREAFEGEAGRCLSCGLCFGCQQCWMYCNPSGYTRLETVGPGMYFSFDPEKCEGCGKCIEICPSGYLAPSE